MNRLIHLEQRKLDRWTKAALKELSPEQQRYVSSMQWHGYTISKARMSGSQNDLLITLERTTVLLADADSDDPKSMLKDRPEVIGMSEELREHIVSKKGSVSRGRVQFRWRREA